MVIGSDLQRREHASQVREEREEATKGAVCVAGVGQPRFKHENMFVLSFFFQLEARNSPHKDKTHTPTHV